MTVANLVLAVDVGNTRAKFGLFGLLENGGTEPLGIVARVLTETADLAAALYDWWRLQGVSLPRIAMIAGSDPETRDQILDSWPLLGCTPTVISGYQQIPIGMDVDVPGRVGVDRRQRSVVTRVHRLQHIQGLFATDFADDNSIGTHTKTIHEQFALANRTVAFEIRRSCFESRHVGLFQLQFGGVFDRDNSLLGRDEERQRIE